MRILVTAGPTHEPLDDVRFLANASSGRLGFAVAAAAMALGHRTVLVCGPTPLPPPFGPETVRVETAASMREACLAAFPAVDAVIMTAAVADWRPAQRHQGKLKKDAGPPDLPLVRTADILSELSSRREHQILVGFALEAADGEVNARQKLTGKGLDLVVLDSPAAIGAERSDFVLLGPGGWRNHYRSISKEILAHRLVSFVANARLLTGR
ncbi:MAG: phosphopantothenoylcysteine decarboxylase [Planctomycetes bacterium]|jgi:phosphopantothenoylcysteine decarboxylase/phosphopantothenate--cysteine ligase|nr:phosphopantothenoylcysteine decarboxylase [Planctomycetota bacterium]